MTTFYNEALPDIDWTNPNTNNLVGLFYFDGTNVVEVLTGTVGTGTPVASGDGFVGEATFNISDLGFNFNDTVTPITVLVVGNMLQTTNGQENTPLKLSNSVTTILHDQNPWFIDRPPTFSANYDTAVADDFFVASEDTNSLGVIIRRTNPNNYVCSFYLNNRIGVQSVPTLQLSDTSDLTQLVFGDTVQKNNILVVFKGAIPVAQLDAIDADPYQLFQTKQDVQQEYGLVFPNEAFPTTAQITYTEIPLGASWSIDTDLFCTAGFNIVAGGNTTNRFLRIDCTVGSNSAMLARINSGFVRTIPLLSDFTNQRIDFKITLSLGGILTVYVNGVLQGSVTNAADVSLPIDRVNDYGGINSTAIMTIYKQIIIDNINPANSRLWNFNKTFGDTATDELNGAIATLNGFPVDSGYVRGANGLIEGYQFDGAGITAAITSITNPVPVGSSLTFTGTWENLNNTFQMFVNIYTTDFFSINAAGNLQTRISYNLMTSSTTLVSGAVFTFRIERTATQYIVFLNGVEQYRHNEIVDLSPMNGFSNITYKFKGQMQSCIINDGIADTYNWDGTTGDQAKIVETQSGNHAFITNDSVVKWQPILVKDVFTVGDYTDAGAFAGARQNSLGVQEYLFSGTQALAATIRINNSSADQLLFRGIGGNFNGDINQADVARLTRTVSNNSVVDLRIGNFKFENLIIDAGTELLGQYNNHNFEVENCGLLGWVYLTDATRHFKMTNSVLHTPLSNNPAILTYSPNTSVINSVVIHDGYTGWDYGALRARGGVGNINVINSIINSVGKSTEDDSTVVGITGNNNILSTNEATALAIGTQDVNLNTYFTNPATNDYTINTTGQTALKTKGWNGTDIVGWAYASAVAISLAISGTVSPSSTEVDIVNGGKTLVLTLTGDTWQPAGTAFDAQRQAIINGLVSAQSEITGWNNEVKGKELVTSVVRTSNTIVTITLSAAVSYNITNTETITTTIPASALTTTTTTNLAGDITFTIIPTATGFKVAWAINSNKLIGAL